MACSRYEYVKEYEIDDPVLKNCWFVVRIDGRNFTEFSNKHKFEKPNDQRALGVMNDAALEVMKQFNDVVIAFGQSDEYSFVFRRTTNLWNRRASKIMSSVVSLFSSTYVMRWAANFTTAPGCERDSSGRTAGDTKTSEWAHTSEPPTVSRDAAASNQTKNVSVGFNASACSELQLPPTFDARIVCYPTDKDIRDYLSWRQVDCHVNNQYNTSFWCLVKSGETPTEAYNILQGTQKAFKNELLYQHGINYNSLPPMYRKGTMLLRKAKLKKEEESEVPDSFKPATVHGSIYQFHTDIIKNTFWEHHLPELVLAP
eukprot:GHVN01030955.1.p1 GENE.GHVN01030955.1~~GHVN01030955.1.p1  ORF type:complete len:314 (-),score=32.99 GHVN01030955.1:573-1514(-)